MKTTSYKSNYKPYALNPYKPQALDRVEQSIPAAFAPNVQGLVAAFGSDSAGVVQGKKGGLSFRVRVPSGFGHATGTRLVIMVKP